MTNFDADRRAGFTLIEVLVALSIIALSLTGISVAMGKMLNNATTLRDRTYASWIAQNKIVEYRNTGTTPEADVSSGELEYANTLWTWRAEVVETGIDGLWRIDVEVGFPGRTERVHAVTGFIGEPTPPGAANQAFFGIVTGDSRGDDGETD